MSESIAKVCHKCGRRYTESEWQSIRQVWGLRSRVRSYTLEMARCDCCGTAISRRVQ